MIKINLLPVRATQKKESAKQQVYIFVFALAAFVGLGILLYSYEMIKIKATNDDIKRSTQELQRLKTVIGEIDNIKKLKDEVKKKLDILNRLRKEKTGPAIRLAKLSDATPDKVWLTKYTETGGNVMISGVAFNEDLIANFMRNLQATDDFINVELLVSEQKEVSGIKVKRFDISCTLNPNTKDEPQQQPKKL
jgi:type IV pilus assembly protein PilN